ncbi:hypothetical protein XENOCAPTIV_002002, partial [Xenoophorus captivus]
QKTPQQKMRKEGITAAYMWVCLQTLPQWRLVSLNPHEKFLSRIPATYPGLHHCPPGRKVIIAVVDAVDTW